MKLSAFARRFFDEKLKSLYRAGFVDGNNELTDKGREYLEVIVLEKYMDDLVVEANRIIEERRKKKAEESDEDGVSK